MSITGIVTAISTGLHALSKVKKAVGDSDSIVEYSKSTRAEPICMIDHTITNMPEINDLMKSLTVIYAAMYTQAFTLAVNATVDGIKVQKALDKINPSAKGWMPSMESHPFKLPKMNTASPKSIVSLESDDDVSKVETGSSTISKFASNLTTGLLFDVKVETKDRKISIPITVRLLANTLPSSGVVSLMTAAVHNRTAKERYREWRSGGISLIRDMVLCRDLLKEFRKNIINDNTGSINEVYERAAKNKIKGMLDSNPSVSLISNILIVDKQSATLFERETAKKLSDAKTRATLFTNTQIMILCVVDAMREVVTMYYHDVSVPTTITFKELKSASKPGNMDVMEVLKAYQMGNGIRL